ncbi:hypothetical protein [Streptomyces roseochromogenus]|uniref:Uncharacterized protein n=1 Tax=Streptomyces roseochromogenus subsp. oscitans DS 12.976 TaxID=1352936 RepID=V6JDB5_STRRC|nr:hypothetical protein [Streptomyces roseochromogenus]EST17912.1 hypothetical protein M878_46160 [Streptomyces roseochromogenus subsp. oscitans DS 12.976]
MTGSLNLPNGNTLWLEEAPKGLRLQPVLGGARLELSLRTWANQATPQTSLLLSATLLVGQNPSHDLQELALVSVQQAVNVTVSPNQTVFVGHVSGQALLETEELRAGGALWLVLRRLRGISVGGDPVGFEFSSGGDLAVEVFSEQWSTQMEKVSSASYIDVMVPITDDPELQKAAGRLRTARSYIRDGIFNAVAAELRQALDAVRVAYDTRKQAPTIRDKKSRDRSVLERWMLEVEDIYSHLSAFIHDDEEAIAGAALDRAQAVELLANVAGKVHRLAADRRAQLI